MGGHKVKKSILTRTQTLGQYDQGYCLKIVLLNFTKLSVGFELTEILAFIARTSLQLNAKAISRKLPKSWKSLKE